MSRIVVGIDGSPGSTAALAWALDEARAHAPSTVVALMAWELPFMAIPPEGAWTESINWDAARREAELLLAETVGGADTTGVEVESRLVEGAAAHALLEEAKGADLLVVGRRGRGGFLALLLGSVSTQIAQHAPCPVVIVPQQAPPG
jgi:nucleotide-binding universal stress UspA family protein